MTRMQAPRRAYTLAKFALVWFVLSIGAAIASPLVQPQAIELICSGSGAMKVLIKSDDGSATTTSHTLDCPLCAQISAPPPVTKLHAEPAQPLAYALQTIPSAHIAAKTAAPPPARGPPTL
jgi:Protein of unknown function (DUF2946)